MEGKHIKTFLVPHYESSYDMKLALSGDGNGFAANLPGMIYSMEDSSPNRFLGGLSLDQVAFSSIAWSPTREVIVGGLPNFNIACYY